MTKRRVKMADIARKCGVSTSTVSLVLRDKPGIPPETRQLVLKAARQLGYRRKSKAAHAHLNPARLHNLGLILKSQPDVPPLANPFYSHILAGIEETCRQRKINLLYATLPVDDNNYPTEVPRLLAEDGTDGLFLVGAFLDHALAPVLGQKKVPLVLVDAYALSNGYDAVVSDNVQGAYQAVSYLIERGHRHIALVGSHPEAYPSLRERRAGYLSALKDHGLTQTYLADCCLNRGEAYEAARSLLSRHPEVTALFGCNDDTAIAAMRAAQALGLRVPEDVSVIGFDDIDLAQHVTPALTTMHVDKAGMGRMAVQLLINRIERPDAAPVTSVIHPCLIERQSVATRTLGDA